MRGVAVGGFVSPKRRKRSATTAATSSAPRRPAFGRLIGRRLPHRPHSEHLVDRLRCVLGAGRLGPFPSHHRGGQCRLGRVDRGLRCRPRGPARRDSVRVRRVSARRSSSWPIARDNVETQKGSLTIAETKFEQGAANELDAKQALANLKNTEQLVPAFEARIRDANLRLCVLLGIPPRDLTPELGDGPIPVAPTRRGGRRPGRPAATTPGCAGRRTAGGRPAARIGVATADLFPHFSDHRRHPRRFGTLREACSPKPPPPASSHPVSTGTS